MSDSPSAQEGGEAGNHFVWYWAIGDHTYLFGFLDKLALTDFRESNKRMAPYWRGQPVEGGLPSELFLRATGDRYDAKGKLADVFQAGTPIVVSKPVRDVFARHDLGGSALQPVKLFQPDYKTPYLGDYWLLQVVPMKQTVIPEVSKSWRMPSVPDTPFIGNIDHRADADDVTVLPETMEGADIWRDPRMNTAVFVSDRLADALQTARLRMPKLIRCRISVDHQ